ncbi:hypothetical protein VTN02DRAFT_5052 [Thermoascus thermophilus]
MKIQLQNLCSNQENTMSSGVSIELEARSIHNERRIPRKRVDVKSGGMCQRGSRRKCALRLHHRHVIEQIQNGKDKLSGPQLVRHLDCNTWRRLGRLEEDRWPIHGCKAFVTFALQQSMYVEAQDASDSGLDPTTCTMLGSSGAGEKKTIT